MTSKDEPPDDAHRTLIDIVSKSAAGLLGLGIKAAIESQVGPEAAAVVAASSIPTIAHVLKSVGTDFAHRTLSIREEKRVEDAVIQAKNKIWERLIAGDLPREDGFFDAPTEGTSPAEQLLEGVLLKCKAEFEEKKARFIANIFTNATFCDVSPALANQVLGLAGSLSYRQLCIVALIGRKDELEFDTTVWNAAALNRSNLEPPTHIEFEAFQHELLDLGTGGRRLLSYTRGSQVNQGNERGELLPLGRAVFDLMSLSELPREDILDLIKAFGGRR